MKAIIVFYDTLNRNYLPSYNAETETIAPNFSRLADQSVQFNNSYVGSVPCIPARRDLHTGRYNFLHREWGPLEPFDDSMPEILKKHGIYSHLISDHLHYWEDGGANYHTRYSSWEIIRGQEGDHWKGDQVDPEIPPVVKIPQKQKGGGTSTLWRSDWVNRRYIKNEDDFPQTKCFDLGTEFIRQNHAEDNWLLHIETFDPHEPFYVPEDFLKLYPEDYHGKHYDWPRGEADETDEEKEHVRRQYRALMSMCDKNLGRVLDLMDEYNLWQDTLLIIGTDHGFLLAEHGYWGKNQMPYYDQVAHTPLFIWDPRFGKRGEKRDALVQIIDWMPTLLEYFNVEIPKDVQGQSLSSVIEEDKPIRDNALFGLFSGHVNVTDGRFVYMRAANPEMANEVYNYTLMPSHMTARFSPQELASAELVPPFSFTKGCPVLKIKSKDLYNVNRFGTMLFDLQKDPTQENPLQEPALEQKMMDALVQLMKQSDSPREQFDRLGLPPND